MPEDDILGLEVAGRDRSDLPDLHVAVLADVLAAGIDVFAMGVREISWG